ncbi:two component transcriptional regulator, LuxR family [Chthoniobacter flavus Ellin428]|jgi:DNA-binding NarL/FixJ family response regulator|uniref:Two component transcriptional regulator, LuxR family n=1 Tax=Chthoniobacter flavus Ellin428 TaxID=497964 RepID=B4D0S7_9BACT|nr:response regulator transcription factor [Chthoniobacter flavus]EDY19939.1 two component transcriptional regulator, LuxR family [Chthoniobacter flavus Ellin428]TCO91790.1 LuxR family two component transcriptional regulator [Chthoniobacter flavus]
MAVATLSSVGSEPRFGASQVKVVLVEDHRMFREWLTQMLGRDSGCEVCGETDNIHDAQRIIHETKPDIVIVDITLKGSSGLELIKDMRAQGLETPVLVLSMHDEALYAERVLRAGARGYISKHEASSTLSKAIRHVLSGQVYLSEGMTASLLEKVSGRKPSTSSGLELLADRELEVFQLIGKGHNGREIAQLLHLGETTVDTYRARIKEKLRLRNAAELYSRAAQWVHENGA